MKVYVRWRGSRDVRGVGVDFDGEGRDRKIFSFIQFIYSGAQLSYFYIHTSSILNSFNVYIVPTKILK